MVWEEGPRIFPIIWGKEEEDDDDVNEGNDDTDSNIVSLTD